MIKIFLKSNIYSIVAILLYTLGVWYFFNFTIDDTYISMRYAENLSNGQGLVFNVGTPPLEAYSNFIFVLLESLLFLLGFKTVVAVKIISYFFGVGTILLLVVIGKLILGDNAKKETGFVQIFIASSSPFIIWTVGGLETVQFIFTVVASFTAYLYAEKSKSIKAKGKWYLLGDTLAFIVMLSRPEGILFTLGAIVYRLLNKAYLSSLYISLLLIIYFVWKWSYFGELMPTPYYAKAHIIDLYGGMNRAIEFLKINVNIIYLLIFPTIFMTILANFKKLRYSIELFIILFMIIYLLYILSLGYQVSMDDAYRYYVPLIVMGGIVFLYFIKNTGYRVNNITIIIILITLVSFRINDLHTAWKKDINWNALSYHVSGEAIADGLASGHIKLGKWLNKNADSNATIVVHDAGAIPYFSKLKTIDVWSLCDKEMLDLNILDKAVLTKKEKNIIKNKKLEYLLKQNPNYIIQDKGIITKTSYIKNYHLLPEVYEYSPWYKLRIYEKNK